MLAGTLLGRAAAAPPARGAGSGLALRARAGARLRGRRSAAAGLLLHTLHGLHPAFRVSKIHATVPWGLLSSALTCAAWVLALRRWWTSLGWRRWPRSFAIAGENPLVAYLMAPFLLSLFALATPLFGGTNFYAALGETTGIGLVRSAVFAWLVVRLSGLMRSRGVRVQL